VCSLLLFVVCWVVGVVLNSGVKQITQARSGFSIIFGVTFNVAILNMLV